jgi:hypothetical protein
MSDARRFHGSELTRPDGCLRQVDRRDRARLASRPFQNNWSQKVTFGWGVGGNALLPVIPRLFNLQGGVPYGRGIGQCSSSQLPDAVIGPDRALTPVTSLSFMV